MRFVALLVCLVPKNSPVSFSGGVSDLWASFPPHFVRKRLPAASYLSRNPLQPPALCFLIITKRTKNGQPLSSKNSRPQEQPVLMRTVSYDRVTPVAAALQAAEPAAVPHSPRHAGVYTSIIRNCLLLGPYSRPMPRALRWS